jgi:hypothetical protein
LGGKLQVRGFLNVNSMENLLLGLPGGGSLPAWSDAGQSHFSFSMPQNAESYGVALAFHPTTLGSAVASKVGSSGRWVSRLFRPSRS